MRILADENIPRVREALAGLDAEITTKLGRAMTRADLQGVDALLVRSVTRVDEALLAGTPVRFVGTATIGTDHIDLDYLKSQGIGFSSAAGSNARSVLEYVLTALAHIAVARGIDWRGKTLGIVGRGNIGSLVEEHAGALGLSTIVCDPPLARAGGGGMFVDLDTLLELSDVVTCHVPLNRQGPDKTVGLIGARELELLGPGGWIVNSSRGVVVDNEALESALAEGRIGGAVLDVWEGEPRISQSLARRVHLATAHIAGYSAEGKLNGTRQIADALRAHFGAPPVRGLQLEPAATPGIAAPGAGDFWSQALHAFTHSYPIMADDWALRETLDLATGDKRGAAFDRLRKDYPERREFANYRFSPSDFREDVVKSLLQLGFTAI
ncbi:MAG: 4-phosphoerythronate dehydrogenase [Sumerlaeia bacterium]